MTQAKDCITLFSSITLQYSPYFTCRTTLIHQISKCTGLILALICSIRLSVRPQPLHHGLNYFNLIQVSISES